MGKKKPEIGITEQLLLGERMEQGTLFTHSAEVDDTVLETKDEKHARKSAEKIFDKLTGKVSRAVEKTSAYLEEQNSTAGAELISVLDTAYESLVVFDTEGTPRGLLELSSSRFGAHLNGGLALVPELHTLVVGFKTEADAHGYDGWIITDASDILSVTTIELLNNGTFEEERVEPLLGWLKELRGK